ncbi:RluA family pseudouridine synthase [Humisphaera borealis]|uniref:RluA family pseudouridine synthase n=1 Tax=Humisphaera borealis TaxID=2807512 RepID=A0A7M2WTX8_9BACT|nr:RluA family pseudouridine synthase [Humisphaera borealis]QOV88936.1 RluA family pseudouridine synthase [Humisphaera borealis]
MSADPDKDAPDLDLPEGGPVMPADADSSAVEADDAEDLRHFKWKVTKNLTRRIDQYLVDRVGYLSRNGVQKVIGEGLVKVNGRVAKASYRPRDGDVIEMVAPPEPISELVPENIPLEVVYEDDHILAINKQADLIVHPARGKWTGTLVNGLVYYGKKWSKLNGDWRPGILHRLDRNTTGIMLVAKSDEAHWRVARQFENRTIQKTYMSICHGVPQLKGNVIDMPIGRDKYIREKQAVRKEENGGRQAVTLYEVQETYTAPPGLMMEHGSHAADKLLPMPVGTTFSLIKLTPKTGRTHQLRVHMTAIGYPMVGDTMYGGKVVVMGEASKDEGGRMKDESEAASGSSLTHPPSSVDLPSFRFARQALHAYEITFTHPISLNPLTLQAPLPPDFVALRKLMGSGTT